MRKGTERRTATPEKTESTKIRITTLEKLRMVALLSKKSMLQVLDDLITPAYDLLIDDDDGGDERDALQE